MREFNKQYKETKTFEKILGIARENNWSTERTMSEYRVAMYIDMELTIKLPLALAELQEIKDTEENESVLGTISKFNSDIISRIDVLCVEHTNIYQELELQIPEQLDGNDFYQAMNRLLKQEYRSIWEEI